MELAVVIFLTSEGSRHRPWISLYSYASRGKAMCNHTHFTVGSFQVNLVVVLSVTCLPQRSFKCLVIYNF